MDYSGFRDRLKASAQEVRAGGQRLAQLNVELARAESRRVAQQYGVAGGMFVAAALLALYGLGFLFATICIALDVVLPLWAAALIVAVLLLLIATTLALIARAMIKSVESPAPQRAAGEAKATAATLQNAAGQVARRARDAALGKNRPPDASASPVSSVSEPPAPPAAAVGAAPAAPEHRSSEPPSTDVGAE